MQKITLRRGITNLHVLQKCSSIPAGCFTHLVRSGAIYVLKNSEINSWQVPVKGVKPRRHTESFRTNFENETTATICRFSCYLLRNWQSHSKDSFQSTNPRSFDDGRCL